MSAIDLQGLKFLVVDDSMNMRRIVRTFLRSFGVSEIFEAEDGATGLELLEAYAPDILIADIKMPIFDGVEFAKMIRNPEGGTQPFVPIIILTVYSEHKYVTAARDAGATEFLSKPISATALYRRIENILNNPREFVRTEDFFGPDRRRAKNPSFAGIERRSGDDSRHLVSSGAETDTVVIDV